MENLIVAAAKKRFLEVYCLTRVCFYETVNNESKTNSQTFEFEIKQSNIMASSKKENTDHSTLEQ